MSQIDDAGPGNDSDQLAVERRNQETNMWCWAASSEMVMDFLGVNVTQCDEANRRLGLSNCCLSPVPAACVQGGWPEFDKYGFTFSKTSYSPLGWDQIVEQISVHHTPIAYSWAWDGGGGHMMVVYGYSVIDGTNYVLIHDPWPPNEGATRTITYEAYVSGTGYSHWDDFYDVTPIHLAPRGRRTTDNMNEPIPGHYEAITNSRTAAARMLKGMRPTPFGAATGAPVQPIMLGRAVSLSTIRLDELKAASAPAPGDNDTASHALLKQEPAKVVYAVTDPQGKVTGEISVHREGDSWKVTGFGSPTIIDRIKTAIPAPGSKPNDSTTSVAAISVPALNNVFVVVNSPAGDRYVPLIDDPPKGFARSQQLSANELLQRLIDAAKAHNNLPC